MAAKKRLTMLDAMDGALSKMGGLTEAAEKAKTLPFKLTSETSPSSPPDSAYAASLNLADKLSTEIQRNNQTNKSNSENKQQNLPIKQTNSTDKIGKQVDKFNIQIQHTNLTDKQNVETKQASLSAESNRQIKQTKRAEKTHDVGGITIKTPARRGFTSMAQRALAAYLLSIGEQVTTLQVIAQESGISYGTVRTALDRLVARGLVIKTPWGNGSRKAQRLTPTPQLAELCQEITTDKSNKQIRHVGTADKFNSEISQQILAYKSNRQISPPLKIDRKDFNLSISLKTFQTAWPSLARSGFGLEQLSQIERMLNEQGKGIDRVVKSLDHLEYELGHGQLCDKTGQQVADPCSWAFRALAQNGYYRRPKGYVSPEEQAVRDAEEEAKAVIAARQKAEQAQFEAWRDGLSEAEREQAMVGHPGGPKDAWLRKVWKERSNKATPETPVR